MNQLEQLSKMTIVVADTGDIEAIKQYKPTDATTNPSLVLKALKGMSEADRNAAIKVAVDYAQSKSKSYSNQNEQKENQIAALPLAVDRMAVEFGLQILKIIPGYVSTELDARLSFDVENSVKRAVNIMNMYEELGVKNVRDRVLIKVATTWEGIQIARILREQHQIKSNLTLLFSIWQAAAAAQIADAFLISPFVGRITDWHKAKQNVDSFDAFKNDPGVISVRNIYGYYKSIGANTIVMGASFRNKEQVLALTGCDRLTIGPKFLAELRETQETVTQFLSKDNFETEYKTKFDVSEKNFRWGMCDDACGTEKLAEGIRRFSADIVTLENLLKKQMN